MRILGIDPGSSVTGFGVVERTGRRVVHLAHGTLRTSRAASLPERLAAIQAGLTRAIAEHRPEVAVVERVFAGRSVRSALVLGHARGVALATAAAAGLTVCEYSASEIKLAVVGTGAAEKHQVQAMVERLLQLAAAPGRIGARRALAGACAGRRRRPRGREARAMIARLEGVLREKAPTRAIVSAGGVGYEVLVSLSTFAALPDEGKTVSLRIHTHVREDALQLFGFHTDLERALFEQLIRVNGVGPRLAQALLSGMSPRDLVAALARGDAAPLCAVPGIGAKTAQRIVLDLRERAAALSAAGAHAEEGPALPPPPGDERLEGVVSALVNLGTARPRAERAAREALDAAADAPLEQLVRAALRRLAR